MGLRLREGLLLISIAMALFLVISFFSYQGTDPAWSNTGGKTILNWGGRAGALIADIFLSLFGIGAYVLPPLIVFASWLGIHHPMECKPFKKNELLFQMAGFILIFMCSSALVALCFNQSKSDLPAGLGGILGDMCALGFRHNFSFKGSALLFTTGLLCGITLFTGISWLGLTDTLGRWVWQGGQWLFQFFRNYRFRIPKTVPAPVLQKPREPKMTKHNDFEQPSQPQPKLRVLDAKVAEPLPRSQIKTVEKKNVTDIIVPPGTIPPVTLLNAPVPTTDKAFTSVTYEDLSHLVEQRLSDFGVSVKVMAVHPGPVITRFELDLAPGVKVSKITGLAKDIARSLSITSVRVVEVIPGKSFIGLEIPNEHCELVGLRDILESQRYGQSRSPVSLALGKDIAGYPVVVDLAKMPHLLVAGTTGSGKSVSLNAMLLSMLFKALPEQLRFIMIDPKMLELSVYEGIPHLLTPVITDMKDAANALRWCVAEMDKRYKLMAGFGVRNLAGYNQKISDSIKQGQPLAVPEWLSALGHPSPILEPLPVIVVIVDEFADMIMVVGKKVEDLIARIAQKARAAGIHLILATQRPSVDVITGLIKANIPTRIAFQVSSRIDSRTILDQQGAEQLLGNGDMLYLPPGTGVPVRIHGAYVADEEVHRVVAAWQSSGKPIYLDEVTEFGEGGSAGGEELTGEADPLYDEALKIVTDSRRASISLVQRKLRIGYNRAARIMEDMETAGVVSAMDGSGSREVLAPPAP